MRTLPAERQAAILKALVEGNSIRATCRMTGAAKGTVLSLLRIVGAHCKNHHDRFVRGVVSKRIQCDEIWSFVGCKRRNVPPEQRDSGERGDIWTWTALDQDSKLAVAYRVGHRDPQTAQAFVSDLEGRLASRVQLTTDGLNLYLSAVEKAFGWARVDYAMLVKLYGPTSVEDQRKYSPAECMGTRKTPIMGKPDEKDVCTSHVERQNLTMRMQMRRFTRLTNGFSKKVEYHLYAVALHFTYYNYCRPHQTLTRVHRGIHTTPAMAAGLTDRVWTVYDLLNLLHGD